jgi:ATP-dependent DNA helicase RecG
LTLPIKVIKLPDGYSFSNPGRLRIPLQRLYEGGFSDARNPNLQKMFQMAGLGEKAGSGFGKILRAWQEQQWLIPLVSEKLDIEVTSVILPMTSFIPEEVEAELKGIVGDAYYQLSDLDRIVLVLAHKFREISNLDVQRYRTEHPRDISLCLRSLVHNGCLSQSGRGRGTRYTLPDRHSESFSLPPSSEHSAPSSEHSAPSSEQYQRLQEIAQPVRSKGSASKEVVKQVILKLCAEDYLTLRTLAELLGRKPDSLRNHYVNPMIDEGLLEPKYPEQISHPQQAYKAVLPDNTDL